MHNICELSDFVFFASLLSVVPDSMTRAPVRCTPEKETTTMLSTFKDVSSTELVKFKNPSDKK